MTVRRTRMDFADLSVGWEAKASQWIQWARTPGHDSYWRFHRDQFLRLLPPPGRQTLPSCPFKISTGCLLPFKRQRAFWNQVGDFAWR